MAATLLVAVPAQAATGAGSSPDAGADEAGDEAGETVMADLRSAVLRSDEHHQSVIPPHS